MKVDCDVPMVTIRASERTLYAYKTLSSEEDNYSLRLVFSSARPYEKNVLQHARPPDIRWDRRSARRCHWLHNQWPVAARVSAT